MSIHVQPRAAKTKYVGFHGDTALKFRVAAPPLEGAANHAICRYLTEYFGVSKSAVVDDGSRGAPQADTAQRFVRGASKAEVCLP